MGVFNRIRCPYCKENLSTAPSRKQKCPSCKQPIFVRKGKLLTKEQAQKLDEEWRRIHLIRRFDIPEKTYEDIRGELFVRFGCEPGVGDVIWSFANEQTGNFIRDGRLHEASSLYFQMALFAEERRKDFSHVLKEARRWQLEYLKSQGFKEIEIVCVDNCCPSCRELRGEKYSIEKALVEMALPNLNCSQANYRGLCRCSYNGTTWNGL